ncbi:phosphatase PAP2 family protein [Mesorhizobium loti]|uniref:phosphatase PAP2 family protein n=1 Tax=Rhizobium loti TaxID=381 RepID=UPI0003F8BCCA|nr:phosphatase PAP2 family protein [Mesorhizobium loti]
MRLRELAPTNERKSFGRSGLGPLSRAAWPGVTLSVAAGLVVAALILVFGALAEEVLDGDTTAFDLAVLSVFRSAADPAKPIGPPWLHEAARDVTSIGSVVFLGFVLLAGVGYLLLIHKRALAILMAVSVVGGEMLSTILKKSFDRPRPDIPHVTQVFTASFPSGHAMLSAITFLTVGALLARANEDPRLKRYFMGLAVFFTMVVGVSRVYLAVHYPTDVLAGWCIGCGWAILCWTVASWFEGPSVKQELKP